MKMVTCITRPVKLQEILDALTDAGIIGITVAQVQGYGKQGGRVQHFRGATYEVKLLPKVRLDIAVPDEKLATVVNILLKTARTGAIGDGKIFVMPIEQAWRIRTGEAGEAAL